MHIHLCGNIDEPTLHPELFDICKWLEESLPEHVWIHISTNGGTRDKKFWKQMASLKRTLIIFGIDGLEDTNHIYRKNVKWKKLEENFKIYIKYGGTASWQFIVFEHNKHQENIAKQKSKDEGFVSFNTVYSSRENYEVEGIKKERKSNSCVKCKATYFNYELEESFFIDVRGNIWPCCWMGTSNYTQKFHDFFGNCLLENNLKYSDFDEIVKSELYSKLWNNLKLMEICNIKCKRNEIDEDNWKIN